MSVFDFNGSARNFGRQIAMGFLDVVCIAIFIMFFVSIVMNLIMPTDDCDRGKFDRCGMRILTDAKTGQEYLVTSKGGIIKRENP